jgi:hypothetical protein
MGVQSRAAVSAESAICSGGHASLQLPQLAPAAPTCVVLELSGRHDRVPALGRALLAAEALADHAHRQLEQQHAWDAPAADLHLIRQRSRSGGGGLRVDLRIIASAWSSCRLALSRGMRRRGGAVQSGGCWGLVSGLAFLGVIVGGIFLQGRQLRGRPRSRGHRGLR